MAGICSTTTAHPYKGVEQVEQWSKDPQALHCSTLLRYTCLKWSRSVRGA